MTNVSALLQPIWNPPRSKDTVLAEWMDSKKALDEAKDKEMMLRKEAITFFPELVAKEEGTVTVDLANGWKLKAVKKKNYNFASAAEVDKAIDAFEKSSAEAAFIAERLIKWKPEWSISEYRLLTPAQLKYFENVLTITDGSPSLELVEPKVKK